MNKKKKPGWLHRFFKGLIIALGFILPGVSGGVLAAILGIYERLLSFLASPFQDFKRELLFFLPIGMGGIVGIGLLASPLEWALDRFPLLVMWGFAGAIMGTLPSLVRASVARSPRDGMDWVWLAVSSLGGFYVLTSLGSWAGVVEPSFPSFILAGGLIALGVLVPGLSPSNLLLIIGLYHPMLQGFEDFALEVFIPIAIGALLVMAIFSKVMKYLLDRFHSRVYHFILGIVAASTVLIVSPPVSLYHHFHWQTGILCALIFGGGLALGSWMGHLEEKHK